MTGKRATLNFRTMSPRLRDQMWSFLKLIYQATREYPSPQLLINQNEPWPDIILLCQIEKDIAKYHCSYLTVDYMENENEELSVNLVEFLDKYFRYFKELNVEMESMVVYRTQSITCDDWFKKSKPRSKEEYSGKELCVVLTDETIQKLVEVFLQQNRIETEIEIYKTFLLTIKIKSYSPDEYKMDCFPFSAWSSQYLDKTTANVLLFQRFLSWLQDEEGKHQGTLLNKHLDKWIETFKENNREITLETFSKINLKYFGIFAVSFQQFPDDLHRFFDVSTSSILGISSESTFLTTLKILDYMAQKKMTFILLTKLKKIAASDMSAFENDLIIVKYTSLKKPDETKRILKFIKKIVDMEKKIILIYRQKDCILHGSSKTLKIEKQIYPWDCFSDHPSYSQLSEEVQNILLDNLVSFQKYDIPLRTITNRETIAKICTSEYLEKLIKTSKISIGKNLYTPITSPIYFERTVRRQSVEIERLRDCFSLSSIVLIMGITMERLNQYDLQASSWTGDDFTKNGLYVLSGRDEASTVYEQCTLYDETLNVFLLEYANDVFFVERFQSINTDLIKVISDVDRAEHIDVEEFCGRPGVKIIADDPGMGKSNFLSQCAHELKNQNNYLWVIMVNQHFTTWLTQANNIVNFLLKTELSLQNLNMKLFEENLLRLSLTSCDDNLQYPKVVLLFDGFLELTEMNQSNAKNIFRRCINKGIDVFITCRLHEKTRLELAFQSTAYRLNSLKEVEKMDYLKENLDILNYKENFFEFYGQVRRIFESINQAGFSGNPSNLSLLAKHSSTTKTILRKFGDLIYSKITISSHGFKRHSAHRPENVISAHGSIAVSKIRTVKKEIEIPDDDLLRIGLLTLDDDGQLTFIHSYYQYYFLAEYISSVIVDSTFLVQVFTDEKYQFLRLLLDETPPACNPRDLVRELKNPNLVVQSIMREGCKNLVKYLLNGIMTFQIAYRRCDKSRFIWCRDRLPVSIYTPRNSKVSLKKSNKPWNCKEIRRTYHFNI